MLPAKAKEKGMKVGWDLDASRRTTLLHNRDVLASRKMHKKEENARAAGYYV